MGTKKSKLAKAAAASNVASEVDAAWRRAAENMEAAYSEMEVFIRACESSPGADDQERKALGERILKLQKKINDEFFDTTRRAKAESNFHLRPPSKPQA
jgi:hypothetical protein